MNKTISIGIILLLFGVVIGYSIGFGNAISMTVKIGNNFLRYNEINVTIDKDMVQKAISSYQSHINFCRENAYIRNNTRD